MKDIILTYLPEFITALGGGAVAWIFGRKRKAIELSKAQEELESSKSTNIENNLAIYQKMIDDIDERSRKRIEELINEVETLKKRYEELEFEFHFYKKNHPKI